MAEYRNITRRNALQKLVGTGAALSISTSATKAFEFQDNKADLLLERLECLFAARWSLVNGPNSTYQNYQDAISIAEVIALAPSQTPADIAVKERVRSSASMKNDTELSLPFETIRRLEIKVEIERRELGA